MTSARYAIVITGSTDPMWPFVRSACTEAEAALLLPFFTDRPRTNSCTYVPADRVLSLKLSGITLGESDIRSVWWRALVSAPPKDADEHLADYCAIEYRYFLEGLEFTLPNAVWVSRPSAIESARSKALQLTIASELGFTVLPTAFSNCPIDIRDRAERQPSVFKSIRSPRVPIRQGEFHTLFTSRLTADALSNVDGVLSCPGIVQAFLDKRGDVRVTVIGDRVFAIFIDSQVSDLSAIDFRRAARNLAYEPFDLSQSDAERCRALLRRLGLEFGAFDFGIGPSGELVFFEVNPIGQWGWLEERTHLPMRRALLDLLLHSKR